MLLRRSTERPAGKHKGLTAAEDQELRQLTWFSMVGDLSDITKRRLSELIRRDRRTQVRDPRPNPSEPAEPPSTLPPLDMDRVSEIICPNCGSMVPASEHALRQALEGHRATNW